ncbi:MAG TPA: hypothetical protein VJL58_08920 [Pyrinomonadaceae bacterium]|nr:hypothetical protein [Pyrinomonadaceae bacterium]
MKNLVIVATFLLAFATPAFSQDKPLTQSEYVKMLYALEKAPSTKVDVIDALRRRGIAFVLTDGVRGLTRSKGRNDEELKRALEEAERRRRSPEATKLPTKAESDSILENARERNRQVIEEMPDFVVKQVISRSGAYAGTGNWKPYDNLVIAVSYSTEKGEQYKVLTKNGAPVDSVVANSYSGLDGATSGGEFVEDLQKIFKPESKTEFELITTDVIRGRPTIVYGYTIDIENNKDGGVGLKGPNPQSTPSGEKGRIWVDRETFRVLRVDYELTDIAPSFPVKAVTKSIDYDMVEIAGEKYLLPIVSDFRGTVAGGDKRFEQRNLIRFRSYQKYGTEVKAVGEDEDVPPEKP